MNKSFVPPPTPSPKESLWDKGGQKRLAIVTTHPIQYYAPVFRMLAERNGIAVKVFYTWGEASLSKHDPGFGKKVEWDIPLLEGYDHEFLENISKAPGSSHFNGIINPDAINKISSYAPDAILVYGWANKSHLKIIRHFKGKVPVWFRGDSNLIDQQPGWKNVARSVFLRWVYSHVDKAFYVGSANKEYFKKYGLKEEQLVFAPHAIDNERFSQDRSLEALELRTSLGIRESDILILFAGKLEPKKDPELLLDAFLSLEQENVQLLFVGNGVLEEGLKLRASTTLSMTGASTTRPDRHGRTLSMTPIDHAQGNKIQVDTSQTSHLSERSSLDTSLRKESFGHISFMDFQNQSMMPVIYQACDVFCLPSKGPGETWGLAVNEAMAAGKAVLVSDKVGCAKDLVKAGENGFIFESGNGEGLKQSISSFCGDKEKIEYMGKKSLEIIAEWSFSVQASSYVEELMNDGAEK